MGAVVVNAEFLVGGISDISRSDLKKISKVLNIKNSDKLPVGKRTRYVLVLETNAPIPTKRPRPKSKKKRI
jgi:hypothetical protein